MRTAGSEAVSPQLDGLRGDEMRTPDEVTAMLRRWALGYSRRCYVHLSLFDAADFVNRCQPLATAGPGGLHVRQTAANRTSDGSYMVAWECFVCWTAKSGAPLTD